jgi:hypothetical protein
MSIAVNTLLKVMTKDYNITKSFVVLSALIQSVHLNVDLDALQEKHSMQIEKENLLKTELKN